MIKIKNNFSRLTYFFIVVFSLLLISCSTLNTEKLAKCMTENEVVMYGAFWCPHCANQKELFGDDFQYVTYVECSLPDRSGQTQVCKDAKINPYPTWEFKDSSRLTGEQTLEILAKKSGCELANN